MNKIGINRRRWVDRQKATRYSSPIISDENNGRVFNTGLKWTLAKMVDACNKPVIDYNTG